MTSRTMRRRLLHGDVDGKKREHLITADLDDLNEPLLGNDEEYNPKQIEKLEAIIYDERRKERLHWTLLFSQLISEWAQWLANIVLGSGSFIARLWTLPSTAGSGQIKKFLPPILSPLQAYEYATQLSLLVKPPLQLSFSDPGSIRKLAARLRNLQKRLAVPFDGSCVEHQDALKQLWRLAYPNRELPELKSELWKEMGWQGSDPSTDFRGGGFISLENLIFFAQRYPCLRAGIYRKQSLLALASGMIRFQSKWNLSSKAMRCVEAFQNLLLKNEGNRADWEYPFAVAGINISFMLVQMLNIQSGTPTTSLGVRFLRFLSHDESAFDELFCVAFRLMDAHWLTKRGSEVHKNATGKGTCTRRCDMRERFTIIQSIKTMKKTV
ncbi:Engulfment/cell motility, ELMO [Cynara cardunculus var. scolymus]|uniref:Engulfment/cell motility, ELMO n=1 Tax=Cynara cardunculus var. scolymus TaxID=59895 RepID=A0A103Y6D9_CYNCS|nr:Engulfment/cell motility, ELMO [Cynara cardunculus var. scolymus]